MPQPPLATTKKGTEKHEKENRIKQRKATHLLVVFKDD